MQSNVARRVETLDDRTTMRLRIVDLETVADFEEVDEEPEEIELHAADLLEIADVREPLGTTRFFPPPISDTAVARIVAEFVYWLDARAWPRPESRSPRQARDARFLPRTW